MRERKPQATTENGVWHYRRERGADQPHKLGRWGSVPHPAIGAEMVSIVLESHTWTEQDEGSIPSSSKGGIMKYRTKVRDLEAIRFDGTNIEAINTLTGLQLYAIAKHFAPEDWWQ